MASLDSSALLYLMFDYKLLLARFGATDRY